MTNEKHCATVIYKQHTVANNTNMILFTKKIKVVETYKHLFYSVSTETVIVNSHSL